MKAPAPKPTGPKVYDWKPAPFGRIRKVRPTEGAAWKDGVCWKEWPAEDVDRLHRLIDAGHGYTSIARRLGRTRTAVEIKCKRLGVRVTTTPATLSARDVAALLGKRCSKSVSRWIASGWLVARNAGGAGCKALWRVQWDDLLAFMERREWWPTWDSARITDAALREWAQELRADEPRYLTAQEVAARYHVGPGTVGQWLDKGFLPAVRVGRQNRLIPEPALEGWVIPSARSLAGIPKGARRRVVGQTEVTAL